MKQISAKGDFMNQNESLFIRLSYNFLKLLWHGVVTASKRSKVMLITYITLGFIQLIVTTFLPEASMYIFSIIFLTALISGIYDYVKGYPGRKTRESFNRIFEVLRFKSKDNRIPYYVKDERISNYAAVIEFNSFIPVSEWYKIKENLEIYLNVKILDILSSKCNKNEIGVIFETQPLPNIIEWQNDYISTGNILTIGVGYYGLITLNLEMHPHSFIAGETGSGKSNVLKCLIHQSLLKQYEVSLIDFKRGVSFSNFMRYVPVHYEYKDILQVLKESINETTSRLDKFRAIGVDNINDYNRCSRANLKRRIIFIDELGELLSTHDKEVSKLLYSSLETLTRLSRAVGIHLIMGIQRPDSTIVNGQIKNNVSFRLCGRFVDREPSQIILGNDMASRLENIKGRFVVRGSTMEVLQTFYFREEKPIPQKQEVAVQNNTPDSKQQNQEINPTNNQLSDNHIDFDFKDVYKKH